MIVCLCSGQGTQHPDIFRLTGNCAAASPVFRAAAETLGCDPRHFVRSASDQALHANRAAQILCVTQALAAYLLLEEDLSPPFLTIGYSVGEVAACGISGLLSVEDTLRLVRVRAELMNQASSPGDGLAAVRALQRDRVESLAQQAKVEIAIINPDNVIIVGGAGDRLRAFCRAAQEEGASYARMLPIAVASHTSKMAAAAAQLCQVVKGYPLARVRPGVLLLNGIEGLVVSDTATAASELSRQMTATLHWAKCLHAAVERGGRVFLELGPGRALTDMVRRIGPELPARSIEDFSSEAGLRTWIRRHRGEASGISHNLTGE